MKWKRRRNSTSISSSGSSSLSSSSSNEKHKREKNTVKRNENRGKRHRTSPGQVKRVVNQRKWKRINNLRKNLFTWVLPDDIFKTHVLIRMHRNEIRRSQF